MSYIGNTVQNQNYVPAIDYFNGNGSTTAFTLSRPVASVAQVQAVISNVPQNPGDAFTVLNNTITFTSAPPSGTNNIYVYYTSPNTQVVQPGQGTVGTNELANGGVTADKLASGAALANIGTGGVTPSYLSTGAPSWDTSSNLSVNGQIRSNAALTPVVFAGSTGTEVGKLARAWCNYNAGTNTIITSFNVSSVTVNAAGDYTFNYTNALPTSDNAVFAEGSGDGGASSPDLYGGAGTNTTTSVRIYGYGSGKFANTMVVFA